MSTIDAIVSVMEDLPEETQKEVLVFARYKLRAAMPTDPSVTHTDEELLAILEHSHQQYLDGKARTMKEAIREARKQHGFI